MLQFMEVSARLLPRRTTLLGTSSYEHLDIPRRPYDFTPSLAKRGLKEDNGGEGIPLRSIIHAPDGSEKLHAISRSFTTIIGDLNDLEDRFDFLVDAGKRYRAAAASKPKLKLSDSAIETLTYFKSRNCSWKRWVENYNERTKLMINLFFSIASQADSRTNLEVADLTATIAADAQKDSSSMITIAAVTMVFLPGTFISVRISFSLSVYNLVTR